MIIYECLLELHDNLFFSTREMGKLYETGSFIHNYALSYALGASGNNCFPVSDYFSEEQIPKYKEHLENANYYVSPAKPINTTFVFNTFKFSEEDYYLKSTISRTKSPKLVDVYSLKSEDSKNKPDYGRAKEISVGSTYLFYINAEDEIKIPKWIRLGKWMSKSEVKIISKINIVDSKKGSYFVNHSLNPLDIPKNNHIKLFDIISMPPSSLINNATIEGEYIEFETSNKSKVCLPANLKYNFN